MKNSKNYMPQHILLDGDSAMPIISLLEEKNVPYAYVNARTLAPYEYMGNHLSDVVTDLIEKANGNYELAQKGVIIVDEIDHLNHENLDEMDLDELTEEDKNNIASSNAWKDRIGQELLSMMRGLQIIVDSYESNKIFDTSNVTFIGVGNISKQEKKNWNYLVRNFSLIKNMKHK